MGDYLTLLDTDIWAFIKETESCYPPDAVGMSVVEQRRFYDQMCRNFAAKHPDGVKTRDEFIATPSHKIPIRTYKNDYKSKAKVIYYHGGGFVVGGLDSHDDVCAEICAATAFEVISVDYRLSPEHPFPADFVDARAAFDHINSGTDLPVVLAGDSAGACLAAAVAQASRHVKKQPAGQVLIYPGLGGDLTNGSYVEHADAPMLTAEDVVYYHKVRSAGDDALLDDPRYSPLRADDFGGLAPTYVLSAECDPLASDGEAYCQALMQAGSEAVWVNEAGLVHGYLRARHRSEKARASFGRIVEAITAIGLSGTLPRA